MMLPGPEDIEGSFQFTMGEEKSTQISLDGVERFGGPFWPLKFAKGLKVFL